MRAKPGGATPSGADVRGEAEQRETSQQEPGAQVPNRYRRRTSRESRNAGLPQDFSGAG